MRLDGICDRLDRRIPPDTEDGTHTQVLLDWSDDGPDSLGRHGPAPDRRALRPGHTGEPELDGVAFGVTIGLKRRNLPGSTTPAVLWHGLDTRRALDSGRIVCMPGSGV